MPHHLTIADEKRRLMTRLSPLYGHLREDGRRVAFAERRLYVDWLEERILS